MTLEDQDAQETSPADRLAVLGVLRQGIDLVGDLNRKLQQLDDLLLSGRPAEIAEAALIVENALAAATPAFSDITETMKRLGAPNLQSAAAYLRDAAQDDAAGLADSLRQALKRFADRSVKASRRAQALNSGLNNALRTLQALGVEESGRLIAEA